MKFFLKHIFFLLLFSGFISGQDSITILKNMDYRLADSLAVHFPKKKYKSITEITGPLTDPLKTPHEKFRAIFKWITENIEYNKSGAALKDADKIVRKNKAVCQGFSNLLKEMCNSVHIDCDTISGYTKTEVRDINKKLKKTDHAWNAVKLYGHWYLVDVTWATSKFNIVSKKFEKNFDEHYYITDPKKFILDHFPKDKQWQFLPKPITAKQFTRMPLYYADYFHFGIEDLSVKKGKFKHKRKKPLTFTCTAISKIDNASILLNYDRYSIDMKLKTTKNPNEYTFDYTFAKKGDYDLTLYYNGLCVAEFLIKVK
ncbi:MAG: hypothetical protein IAF38_00220 [Bacteroidia bacterium]|nr:hypothetical protein [Bacteroidia bacterium]